MTGIKFPYFFMMALIVSCNSTSLLTEINPATSENKISTLCFTEERMDFIDSYISKIDFKANDSNQFNVDELEIHGDERIITSNESEKNIVFKKKSIVRVKFKDHLFNNFIKSKVFYYENDELIAIKICEILPNEFNKATLYIRTIYIHNALPISDSDEFNKVNDAQNLVTLGHEYLKNEYHSLN